MIIVFFGLRLELFSLVIKVFEGFFGKSLKREFSFVIEGFCRILEIAFFFFIY